MDTTEETETETETGCYCGTSTSDSGTLVCVKCSQSYHIGKDRNTEVCHSYMGPNIHENGHQVGSILFKQYL